MRRIPIGPRLTVELVPSSCWYSNVRSEVPPDVWDRLRRAVYRAASYRCEICGGVGPNHPVECHEVWYFDDAAKEQRLIKMVALCPSCHQVKHIGLAQVNGQGEKATVHLAKVNGWTMEQARAHVSEAFAVWKKRSQSEWTLNIQHLTVYGYEPVGPTRVKSS